MIYRDESGLERARTPHGYMYDANVDPRSGEAPTSYGVDFALIASGKGGTALEVTLDRAWLDDPARQYPVVVDPEFVTATGADDTYVMSNIAPNSAATETELKVGTYDGGTHVARAFLHFNTAPISGKVIQWGRLDIAERHSYNCANVGPTPYRVTESWTGSTLTTWPGKPIDVPAGGSLNAVSGSCPNRLFSADMNGASANWASGAWTNLGIALVAPSESNSNYYKRFASFDSGAPPALHVGWTEPTATVPSAPQSLVATARNLSASVTWAAPASNGGAAVDNYIVYAYNYPAGTPAGPYSYACGTCTSTTVAGLTNGQQYYFAAYAHNAIGWGAVAGSNVVVPAPQPPTPPQSPSATPRNTSAIVSWAPPADNGGSAILDYYVFPYLYPSLAQLPYVVACATCTSVNVPNLTNGQQYIFGIYARNAVNFSTGVATNIVTPAVTTPNAPATVIASPGNTSATVAWSAPTDNGGGAITASYAMAFTTNPVADAQKFVQVCATCTSGTITGLTNGVAYQFLAFASNSAGNGAYTWSNVVTPGGSADLLAATNVVAVRGDTQAQLTWTAPITRLLFPVSYSITTYKADGTVIGSPTSVPATQAATVAANVTGLTNGMAVYFRMTATTLVFVTSPLSAASNTITPAGKPFAVSNVTVTAGDGQAAVTWTPAVANGSPVTSYTVTISPGGAMAITPDGVTTHATITGLANGTSYTFVVVATNVVGDSLPSTASPPGTPSGIPSPPTGATAAAGNGEATVTWTGSSPNGSAILNYTVTASPGGHAATTPNGSTTSLVVSGLTNGTQYTFEVVATNANGTSGLSSASTPVTPATLPSSPSSVTTTSGDSNVTVFWTSATSNGSPITIYTVTASPGGAIQTFNGATRSAAFTGLTNHTTYTFTVVATNAVGDSDPRTSDPVTPIGPITGLAAAYAKFTVEDPAQIDVTSIRNDVAWSFDGICTREQYSTQSAPDHFQQSGWRELSFSSSESQSCAETSVSGSAGFWNPVFCSAIMADESAPPTYITYDSVTATGNPDGTFTWTLMTDDNPDITGGCGTLLDHQIQHGFLYGP